MNGMGDQPKSNHEPEPTEDEYPILPPDPDALEYKPALYRELPEEFPEEQTEPEAREFLQFSLAELFVVVTVAAMVLGIVTSLPGGSLKMIAGAAGLGVLASFVTLQLCQPRWRIIYFIWWMMFISYLVICLAAVAAT